MNALPLLSILLSSALGAAQPNQRNTRSDPRDVRMAAHLRTSPDGTVLAYDEAGQLVWQFKTDLQGKFQARRRANGTTLIGDRYVVDELGRLVAELDVDEMLAQRQNLAGAEALAWSDPEQLVDPIADEQYAFEGPVKTPSGDYWAFSFRFPQEGIDAGLLAHKYDSALGEWLPPDEIYTAPNLIAWSSAAVDATGIVYVCYRLIGTPYRLQVHRYEPGAGWSGPEIAYASLEFFQETDMAIDPDGDVIISFDPDVARAETVIRDATTGQWSTAELHSPANKTAYLTTLLNNEAGTDIAVCWWVYQFFGRGIYCRAFESETNAWGPVEKVPGSQRGSYYGSVGPGSSIPGAMDDHGNLTLIYHQRRPRWSDRAVPTYASRHEGGVWRSPVVIKPPTADWPGSIQNFADVDANEFGDAIAIFKQGSSLSGTNVWVMRFDAMEGRWAPIESIYEDFSGSSQRTRVSWRTGATAVATYVDADRRLLTSQIFDGAEWTGEQIDIPGGGASLYETISSEDETLMILGNLIPSATFLRPQ